MRAQRDCLECLPVLSLALTYRSVSVGGCHLLQNDDLICKGFLDRGVTAFQQSLIALCQRVQGSLSGNQWDRCPEPPKLAPWPLCGSARAPR